MRLRDFSVSPVWGISEGDDAARACDAATVAGTLTILLLVVGRCVDRWSRTGDVEMVEV